MAQNSSHWLSTIGSHLNFISIPWQSIFHHNSLKKIYAICNFFAPFNKFMTISQELSPFSTNNYHPTSRRLPHILIARFRMDPSIAQPAPLLSKNNYPKHKWHVSMDGFSESFCMEPSIVYRQPNRGDCYSYLCLKVISQNYS